MMGPSHTARMTDELYLRGLYEDIVDAERISDALSSWLDRARQAIAELVPFRQMKTSPPYRDRYVIPRASR